MKKLIIPVLALGCLVACENKEKTTQIPSYICGAYDVEFTFTEDGNIMHAIIAGDAVDLTLAPSASGAKYTGVLNDTNIVLWGKGEALTMYIGPDETMIECSIK